MMGDLLSRAASREATTVEEEVTFCEELNTIPDINRWASGTHNGGDGELVFLGVIEQL